MDYFVSVYFNFYAYESRRRLTQEFMNRYPWVHLLQVIYGSNEPDIKCPNTTIIHKDTFEGFITNELVNCFVKLHSDLNSITIIDSDLNLFPFFTFLVIDKINNSKGKALFLQPFSTAKDIDVVINGSQRVHAPVNSCAKIYELSGKLSKNTHTGYIHTYSKELIKLIFPLSTNFVLGGFDTFILNFLINSGVRISYIEGHIEHNYHGNKYLRYNNRNALYALKMSPEIIDQYFKSRDEDNS